MHRSRPGTPQNNNNKSPKKLNQFLFPAKKTDIKDIENIKKNESKDEIDKLIITGEGNNIYDKERINLLKLKGKSSSDLKIKIKNNNIIFANKNTEASDLTVSDQLSLKQTNDKGTSTDDLPVIKITENKENNNSMMTEKSEVKFDRNKLLNANPNTYTKTALYNHRNKMRVDTHKYYEESENSSINNLIENLRENTLPNIRDFKGPFSFFNQEKEKNENISQNNFFFDEFQRYHSNGLFKNKINNSSDSFKNNSSKSSTKNDRKYQNYDKNSGRSTDTYQDINYQRNVPQNARENLSENVPEVDENRKDDEHFTSQLILSADPLLLIYQVCPSVRVH